MKVKDIMTRNPIIEYPSTPINEITNIFNKRKIWSIYIQESGKLVGIVTRNDLKFRGKGKPKETPVSEIMSRDVYTIDLNSDVKDAIALIHKLRINGLAVTDKGSFCGVITRYDINNRYYSPVIHDVKKKERSKKPKTDPESIMIFPVLSAFSEKGDLDLTFFEYLVWASLPFVILYLLGFDFSSGFILLVGLFVFFPLLLAPAFAYTGTFTWVILLGRKGKFQRNSVGFAILEWIVWAIVVPSLYLFLYLYGKTTPEYSFAAVWNSYHTFITSYIVGTIYFVWFIAAPLLAYIGVITRPLAEKKRIKKFIEEEKKDLITTMSTITGLSNRSKEQLNCEIGNEHLIDEKEDGEIYHMSMRMKIILCILIIFACLSIILMLGALLKMV